MSQSPRFSQSLLSPPQSGFIFSPIQSFSSTPLSYRYDSTTLKHLNVPNTTTPDSSFANDHGLIETRLPSPIPELTSDFTSTKRPQRSLFHDFCKTPNKKQKTSIPNDAFQSQSITDSSFYNDLDKTHVIDPTWTRIEIIESSNQNNSDLNETQMSIFLKNQFQKYIYDHPKDQIFTVDEGMKFESLAKIKQSHIKLKLGPSIPFPLVVHSNQFNNCRQKGSVRYDGFGQLFVHDELIWIRESRESVHYLGLKQGSNTTNLDKIIEQLELSDQPEELLMVTRCNSKRRIVCLDVDSNDNDKQYSGWTISHELCNLKHSTQTMTIDIASISSHRKSQGCNEEITLDVQLNLNIQMIYDPLMFQFGDYTAQTSSKFLNNQCNTFLREKASTVYLLPYWEKQLSSSTESVIKQLEKKFQHIRTFNGKIPLEMNKSWYALSKYKTEEIKTVSKTEKTESERIINIFYFACEMFELFQGQLSRKAYTPIFVLLITPDTLWDCFLFFQIYERLQIIYQINNLHEITRYFRRRRIDLDWLKLLAKSHFFQSLARPLYNYYEVCSAFNPKTSRQILNNTILRLIHFELQRKKIDLPIFHVFNCWIELSKIEKLDQFLLQESFELTENTFASDIETGCLLEMLEDSIKGLNKIKIMEIYQNSLSKWFDCDIYRTIISRYLPPIIQHTLTSNETRQLLLHYLILYQKNPFPFSTSDVENASIMCSLMTLFPSLAGVCISDKNRKRHKLFKLRQQKNPDFEKDVTRYLNDDDKANIQLIGHQWFLSSMSTMTIDYIKNPTTQVKLPLGRLFEFSECQRFHSHLIKIIQPKPISNHSANIEFPFDIRWDPHIYAITNKIINSSNSVSVENYVAIKIQNICDKLLSDEDCQLVKTLKTTADWFDAYITNYDLAIKMPILKDVHKYQIISSPVRKEDIALILTPSRSI